MYRLEEVLARDSLDWNLGSRQISSASQHGSIRYDRPCLELCGTVRNPIIFSFSMIQNRFLWEVVSSPNLSSARWVLPWVFSINENAWIPFYTFIIL